MRSEHEIRHAIAKLLADSRLDPDRLANCATNPALALIQARLEGRVVGLLYALGEAGGSIEELRKRFPLDEMNHR